MLYTNPPTFIPFLVMKCRSQRTGAVTGAEGARHSSSSLVSSVVQGMACLPFHFFLNRKIATVCGSFICFKWISK